MSYLFAAYAVFWALTIAFVFRVHARQRALDKQVAALRDALSQQEQHPG